MDDPQTGPSLTTTWGASSERGPVRDTNEDHWRVLPPFFAVADGMGGHACGDTAAQVALDALVDVLTPDVAAGRWPELSTLDEGIARAAHEVEALTSVADGVAAPGTTLTGVLAIPRDARPQWVAFNVGDSRTYLVSGSTCVRLTRDHSAREEALRAAAATGEDLPLPGRNILTRALGAGIAAPPEVDYVALPVAPTDRIVMCTDGVHGVLDDEEITRIVLAHEDPQAGADALVAEALARGTRDNATALVVAVAQVRPRWPAGAPLAAAERQLRRVRRTDPTGDTGGDASLSR